MGDPLEIAVVAAQLGVRARATDPLRDELLQFLSLGFQLRRRGWIMEMMLHQIRSLCSSIRFRRGFQHYNFQEDCVM